MRIYKGILDKVIIEDTRGATRYLESKGLLEWGHERKEAANLARAILADLYGEDSGMLLLAERFKTDVIAKIEGDFAITEKQINSYVDGGKFLALGWARRRDITDRGKEVDLWLLAKQLLEVLANSNIYDSPGDALLEAARLASRLAAEVAERWLCSI